MEQTENRLKKSFSKGDVTYGIWNTLVNTYVGELCAITGYDWIVVDAEHGTFELKDILNQLGALSRYNSEAAVRVTDQNPGFIKRILDMGCRNIIVPMVESADQAEQLVKAIHYAPEGIRGAAPAVSRAALFGTVDDYLDNSSEYISLTVQIETMKGIEAIDDICSIEGVDCLFIGPTDLATSMGYSGDYFSAPVEKVILDSLARIRKNGKSAGILAPDKQRSDLYIQNGANMVGVAADLLLLKKALSENISEYRQ